jgi:hypothetical protein
MSNIIKVRYVEFIGERSNACRVLVGNPTGQDLLYEYMFDVIHCMRYIYEAMQDVPAVGPTPVLRRLVVIISGIFCYFILMLAVAIGSNPGSSE